VIGLEEEGLHLKEGTENREVRDRDTGEGKLAILGGYCQDTKGNQCQVRKSEEVSQIN